MSKAKDLVDKAEKVDSDLKINELQSQLSSFKRKHADLTAHSSNLQKQVNVLAGLDCNPVVYGFQKRKSRKSKGVAVIIPASDWHVEERISSEGTDGKNFFNLVEAERRIRQFYAKIIKLLAWQNKLAPVKEIWHPLMGDLLSGYIHEELMESNEISPTEACMFLQEMIVSGINLLLKETKLPIFIPTCYGNHGRTTLRARIKTGYANSYEWLLYSTLAKFYKSNRRVHWKVGKGYHNICDIMGRRVRFHHGDGIRYYGGVGGISIPVNKAIAQWDKIKQVDLDVFGHYHQFLWNYNKWVACGTLMGFSEYSINIKADFQHPTQTFIVIDRDFGVTSAIPIFLTPAERLLI